MWCVVVLAGVVCVCSEWLSACCIVSCLVTWLLVLANITCFCKHLVIFTVQWRIQASDVATPPSPPSLWSDWILDNFWTVFVSFVLRLNRKIRVPRLLVTVHVFCLLQTASKCTQTYHFRDKKWFLSREGTSASTAPHPTLSTPTAPCPTLLRS